MEGGEGGGGVSHGACAFIATRTAVFRPAYENSQFLMAFIGTYTPPSQPPPLPLILLHSHLYPIPYTLMPAQTTHSVYLLRI